MAVLDNEAVAEQVRSPCVAVSCVTRRAGAGQCGFPLGCQLGWCSADCMDVAHGVAVRPQLSRATTESDCCDGTVPAGMNSKRTPADDRRR